MGPEGADSSILVAAVAAGITVKRFWRSYTVIDRLTLKSTARRRIPADLRADHAASTDDVAFPAQADMQRPGSRAGTQESCCQLFTLSGEASMW